MQSKMPDFRFVANDKFESELVTIIQAAYDSSTQRTNTQNDNFYVGLSGGSMPQLLIRCFKKLRNVDWRRWTFFFCDERLVPSNSLESTFGAYKRLIEPVDPLLPVSLNQFVVVDTSLTGTKAAEDYASKLRQRFEGNLPRFNILFLGVGPDGHTCSLFPNHKLLKEQTKLVAYIGDSPKPPPERVTFTLPVMTQARLCLFLVQGQSKAEVIHEIVENNALLPAQMVAPQAGKLIWLIDEDAGSLVPLDHRD